MNGYDYKILRIPRKMIRKDPVQKRENPQDTTTTKFLFFLLIKRENPVQKSHCS